jgi:hypothetical protein
MAEIFWQETCNTHWYSNLKQRYDHGKLTNPLIFIPNDLRRSRAKNKGEKANYIYLRHEASNFIKRKAVREYIFKKDNYKCKNCNRQPIPD